MLMHWSDHEYFQGYYISSGLNLYYIYDFCLYSSMSAVVSYTIRFLPLLVALAACPLVFVIRYTVVLTDHSIAHSSNLCPTHPPRRIFQKRWRSVQHYGLWWIVLLLYSHVVHSCLSVLNCPSLPDGMGVTKAV